MVRLEVQSNLILMLNFQEYFNSKMVRLEDARKEAYRLKTLYFNSKMVRLEVNSTVTITNQATDFNSKMVRLEELPFRIAQRL